MRSSGQSVPARLEQNAIAVQLIKPAPRLSVTKHERGFGLQKPTLTAGERTVSGARAQKLTLMLALTLVSNTAKDLASYACNGCHPKYVLSLEINSIAFDTDGSTEATLTAVLTPAGGKPIWLRTVRVSESKFSSDEAVSTDLARAVFEEMRSSGLLS
ncbi:MAG: hypothetical protein ACJ8LG_25110 [Massilia sp.]